MDAATPLEANATGNGTSGGTSGGTYGGTSARDASLLAAECRLLELVATGEPLGSLLRVLCLAVEALEPEAVCSVLLVDASGQSLAHGAAPSLSQAFTQATDGARLEEQEGPCAAAAHLMEPVIVEDFASDARWAASYLDIVLSLGLRAGWSVPILARNHAPIGAFAIYFRTPGRPSPWQFHLIERFSHVASIAIERANAEAQLQRSEAHLAMAQRLSATGSFSWTPATGHVEWSDEVYRIYAVPVGERPNLAMARARVHPDDRDLFDRVAAAAVHAWADLDFSHRLQLPDGTVRHLHIMATPVQGPDGRLTTYFGAIRDVTERWLAEEALGQARVQLSHVARLATLGELTASIAHEVNQPLAGIVMNADASLRLLGEQPPDVGRVGDAVQRIRRDAQRAADVIVRLRALFKGDTSERQPLDLHESIVEVLSLSGAEARRAGVTLRTEFATGHPRVSGNRLQLQQVVLNLLVNAVEALATHGEGGRVVTIRTSESDERLRVSVHDDGPGIPPANAERIFDPLFTTKPGGMGMGLSIARTIVESHGGRMWVDNTPGAGTTLTFELQRAP